MSKTVNFNFDLIDFDKAAWHTDEHKNWQLADAVLKRYLSLTNVQGVWDNALTVAVDEVYVDSDLGTLFTVLVAHTTPSTGTFAAARTATSTEWIAYTDPTATESGIKMSFTTAVADTDQGLSKIWLNNATPSSATVLYVDDVEFDGVNINDWADALDDVTNTAARGTLYLAKYGSSSDLMIFNITGEVTSASTYTKVPVTHVLTVGSFSDADTIGVLFIPSGSDRTDDEQYLGGDGTVLLPFYSFSSDPNSGIYRIGADNFGISLGGSKVVDYSTTGVNITGTITSSGILSVDSTTESTSGTTGSIHTDGGLGIAKKLHVIGTTTHGGDILSDTDSTDSLGSTGVRWLKLWVDTIQTTGNTDIAGDLTITGSLTVNGTTVTNDATNTEIKDPLIELNSGAGSNANDLGLIFERGSTGDNGFLGWDESGDYFVVGTTSATGDSTGNITYSFAPFKCSAITATSGTLAGITSLGLNAGATITAGILDEDTMSSDSAVALATQQSIKAYTDNNAPENGVKFAFESTTTDTDQGAGKVWLNNGTPSSATVLYIDDLEAGGVSVNSWVDTFDDVSNAAARGYIYIASYGTSNAILVYKVTGSVTSASTYSKIAVTHVLTVGTISDADSIGLTFVPSGADGTGTVTSIAAGAGFSFSTITSTGTIAVDGVLQDLDTLGPVSSDGEFLVGTGSGAFAYESGTTARTSLGAVGIGLTLALGG